MDLKDASIKVFTYVQAPSHLCSCMEHKMSDLPPVYKPIDHPKDVARAANTDG